MPEHTHTRLVENGLYVCGMLFMWCANMWNFASKPLLWNLLPWGAGVHLTSLFTHTHTSRPVTCNMLACISLISMYFKAWYLWLALPLHVNVSFCHSRYLFSTTCSSGGDLMQEKPPPPSPFSIRAAVLSALQLIYIFNQTIYTNNGCSSLTVFIKKVTCQVLLY